MPKLLNLLASTATCAACLTQATQAATPNASGATPPIIVVCSGSVPPAVCAGMQDQLVADFGANTIHVQPDGDLSSPAVTVQFIPILHDAQVLAGHLEWRTPSGTLTGPRVDLTVIDSTLQDEMLREFGTQLISVSPRPF